MAIVVSDTSPIRALQHLGILAVLDDLYGQVYLPDAVADELRAPTRRFPPFDARACKFLLVQSPRNAARVNELELRLDRGEAAALTLALELNAELVLMDERAGRQVARELGLSVVGVLGILIQAKDRGFIATVHPLLQRLRTELDFYLTPALVAEVLKRAGETGAPQ